METDVAVEITTLQTRANALYDRWLALAVPVNEQEAKVHEATWRQIHNEIEGKQVILEVLMYETAILRQLQSMRRDLRERFWTLLSKRSLLLNWGRAIDKAVLR